MTDTDSALPLFAGYGIELEYMIVDRERLDVRPLTDQVLKRVAGEYVNEILDGPIGWSNELVLHVIEIKTNGPAASLEPLPGQFLSDIGRINDILAEHGAQLMPGAMHPWMDPWRETRLWPHEASEIYDSYNRIFDCQGHGWSNLQSMHVNLPFADDREFAALHAAIRVLLPAMPALAASSPLMQSEYTGLLDTRLETYRHNSRRIPSITGLVVPEAATGRQHYQDTILSPMYRDIAALDPGRILQHEWLNSRGAIARFDRNAIEIRVLDVQESAHADVAIAALIVAVLKRLVGQRWSDSTRHNALATAALAELLQRAIKDAEQALIDDRDYLSLFAFPDRKCELRELWQYLLETLDGEGAELAPPLRAAVALILDRGSLARRIRQAIGGQVHRPRLEETYRRLCECLAQGRSFEGLD